MVAKSPVGTKVMVTFHFPNAYRIMGVSEKRLFTPKFPWSLSIFHGILTIQLGELVPHFQSME